MNGVAVYLPIEDWNKVLAILAQAQWAVANPLIMAIGDQLRAAAIPPSGSATQYARPNGEDTA